MKNNPFSLKLSRELLLNSVLATLMVIAVTVVLALIGRNTLGEAVIALLYLVPVGWCAARWGQGPGIAAAVIAALAFDFFFIPPFYTFTVGNLEGWLVLAIFMAVAIIVVGRIQSGLTKAHTSEREALFMYELSSTLSGLQTQEAVAHALARHLQQIFQAGRVEVFIQPVNHTTPITVASPIENSVSGKPDQVLPILARPGLVGEIRLWRGHGWLPPEEGRLVKNLAAQTGLALERAHLFGIEERANAGVHS